MVKSHTDFGNNQKHLLCVGIVGAGYAASVHSNALKRIDPLITQYVYDVNTNTSKTFAEKHRCQVVDDLDTLFKYVNAVIIATPVSTHYSIALNAIKHNKHILCEKPMSAHVLESLEMCQMSQKRTNLICAIGFNYRFFEITKYIKRKIKIGKIYKINLSVKRLFRDDWKHNEISVLSDLGIHLIDLLSYLTDSNISLIDCKVQMKYINGCDYDSIVCGKMDNGTLFEICTARIKNANDVSFCIQAIGESGILEYDSRNEHVYKIKYKNNILCFRLNKEIETDDFFDFSDSILRQDRKWIDAIFGNFNGKDLATFNDGYRAQIALEKFLAK